ncbi:conserved hypothetical protein [Sporisorium reilianum SRZ2]|uniref:Uncharacterized protein n=1 Tax=Sporisorium reilianum (strain SRZ2) TaxID=999809 RepID=E6ZSF0_SPORE|nr:conserved hypothetical protein [Sporisorium reilianum SRZ2]
MSAETTHQPQGADPSPQQPPSSPIDGFGSPSLLTLPPPLDRSTRSQSSSHLPPRLDLVSSSTMSQAKSTSGSAMRPRAANEVEEEVDELDEFDADAPNELDFEVCDKLEAESLRAATQRREQSASANSLGGGGSGTSASPQKRTRTPSMLSHTQVIDLRDTSPEPPTQQPKRSKTQKPADDGGPLTPFFEEEWVRDVLAKSKGVRAFSPPEPIGGPGLNAREPQQSPASHAPRKSNGQTAVQGKAPSQRHPAQQGSGSTDLTAFRNTGSGNISSSSSSSDEDTPLAATLRASMAVLNESAPRRAAMAKIVNAVAELDAACEREVESIKVKLVERDLVINALRARLRKRPSK